MSVVAWDGRNFAADKQSSRCGLSRVTTKIFQDGTRYYGCVGTEETGLVMMEWHRNGAVREEFPECQKDDEHWSHLIVIDNIQSVFYYSRWPIPIRLQQSYFAWGAGEDFAMGAMAAGADAIRAVEIANYLSVDCGNGVDAYDVHIGRKVR